ncbi:MAG: cobalamin B12-binding domain-containing protein [Candidatus Freyarchaeota archaeon]
MEKLKELPDALADLEEEETLKIVKENLEAHEDPTKILESCKNGMTIVGDRFEKGEYFLSDMLMAAEIFRKAMELIRPALEKVAVKTLGKIVIGTVQGDIHNLGKNIARALLEAAGFEVHDLGEDVPPEKFVDAIKEVKPEIVGMSGLLTLAIESMKKTVEAIREANLRERVKIIIGSCRLDETAREYIGADAWTNEAAEGVKICEEWVGGE